MEGFSFHVLSKMEWYHKKDPIAIAFQFRYKEIFDKEKQVE
jgi:hypothetical protein